MTAQQRLEAIPQVEIDDTGVFKYVLILVADAKDESLQRLVVRGNAEAEYHADIYEEFCRKTEGRIYRSTDVSVIENFTQGAEILSFLVKIGYSLAPHLGSQYEIRKPSVFDRANMSFEQFENKQVSIPIGV